MVFLPVKSVGLMFSEMVKMMSNKDYFSKGEADNWFQRNIKTLCSGEDDKVSELLRDWLEPFGENIETIVEVGCGSAHRLSHLSNQLNARGYGVEPSNKAVEYASNTFPDLTIKAGYGDDVPFEDKYFDLVHLGFFLYLVDRDKYLKCISEADRLLKFGGFLSIIDFETPYPYSNEYSHQKGVFSHKTDNAKVFVGTGFYSIVNKFQFSHSNFFFDKNINERVSLTLLYKEDRLFGGC